MPKKSVSKPVDSCKTINNDTKKRINDAIKLHFKFVGNMKATHLFDAGQDSDGTTHSRYRVTWWLENDIGESRFVSVKMKDDTIIVEDKSLP